MPKKALTDTDLVAIRELIKLAFDDELEKKFEEKLKYLPNKEQFFSKMDEIMGELKKIREEQIILVDKVNQHDKLLSKITQVILTD